jgi:hypothetical protein
MKKNKIISGLVMAIVCFTCVASASATTYVYTFGEKVQGSQPMPSLVSDFATLTFDDVSKTFNLKLDAGFSVFGTGAFIDSLAVNYSDGSRRTTAALPSATSFSASSGINGISVSSNNGPYGGGGNNDPFRFNIGSGNPGRASNRLSGVESASWISNLNDNFLVNYKNVSSGGPNDTFALLVHGISRGEDNEGTSAWYEATSVTAVPEPEVYGMMLMGLGLLGFVATRRKNN